MKILMSFQLDLKYYVWFGYVAALTMYRMG
jgi:hypothetical protein